MAKSGSVLLGAVIFLSGSFGVGCASVVGIKDLPPATDSSGSSSGIGSSSSPGGRSSSTSSGSGGSVSVGSACFVDADCSQSQCTAGASCVDWGDGNGSICSCNCTWGTDCPSGCCWSVNSGSFQACRPASACQPIGEFCTDDYQCENNDCQGFKTYCLDEACTCGCMFNTDCDVSACCSTLSNGTQTANICDDLFRNCMAR